MGEYADMFINGLVDMETGELIDGDAPGYPRKKKRKPTGDKTHQCDWCGRWLRGKQGKADHMKAKHPEINHP